MAFWTTWFPFRKKIAEGRFWVAILPLGWGSPLPLPLCIPLSFKVKELCLWSLCHLAAVGIEFILPWVIDSPSHHVAKTSLIVRVCTHPNVPEEGQSSPLLRHGMAVRSYLMCGTRVHTSAVIGLTPDVGFRLLSRGGCTLVLEGRVTPQPGWSESGWSVELGEQHSVRWPGGQTSPETEIPGPCALHKST